MSSDKMEGFSSSLFGGFSRRDVIKYVERLSNEHEEETNARIKEIDQLKARLAEREGELKKTAEKLQETEKIHDEALSSIMTLNEEVRRQKDCLEAAFDECQVLKKEAEKSQSEIRDIDLWKSRIASYRVAVQELKEAKIKVANIELEAIRRAEQIEREAKLNAEMILKEFCSSVGDLKSKFEVCQRNVNSLLEEILIQSDAIRSFTQKFQADFNDDSKKALGLFSDSEFKYTSPIDIVDNLPDIDFDDDFENLLETTEEESGAEPPIPAEISVMSPVSAAIGDDESAEEDETGESAGEHDETEPDEDPMPDKFGEIFDSSDDSKYDKYME